MKNKIFFKNSVAILLPIAMAVGVLFGTAKTPVQEVSAYSVSSLPTTIDLNDTSAANIRSYYSSLNNLSTSERQGTNLLKNLKTILKNGQKYYSYDSGNAIWQMYEITDRDWDRSPASSTTYGTYNSTTNKITNYTYGTSSSSSKNNPYIHALYINRNITNQTTAWDDHQQTEWGINREHVWPKAEGFENSGAGGARGDPMHLMAGNGYSNNIHSNYYYGYVDTSKSYTNCGTKYSNQNGNLRGTSKTVGGSTSVFEPQDCDKGDIARAIFYMVARYNYLSGSDSDGIDSNNPNLTLTQSLSDWANSGYSSTTSNPGKMGIMTDLLAWHHADPVDEYEIHRNNLLYTNFTNNRNPFIDFPEWVDFIWGTATYNGKSYQSYSSTPTGYATPTSDTINGYNSSQSSVSVTGVSLNKNSTSIDAGRSETLTANISPSNATNQGLTWTTSNSNVATVSGGTIYGVSEGNATITVRTNDGGFTATCSVTVTAATPTPDGDAELYSGSLTEGDYVLYYDGKAMDNEISLNRFSYAEVTPSNDIISSPDASIVWHIAQVGDYWTIYNNQAGKYAAGNGTKNQGALIDSVADYSKWSVSGSSTYEFINKGNSSDGVNCNLRNNGTYGFACYSTSTGGALSLYKVSGSSGSSDVVTSITATCSKTFYVGETISSSDITVKDNLGNSINDFEFEPHFITYEDTPNGGDSSFELDFDIEYNEFETSLSIDVERKAYETPTPQNISLDSSEVFSNIGGSNNSLQSGNVTVGGITYDYYKAYYYTNGSSLSFGNSSSQAGYVKNSTPFGSKITNVDVTGSGRTFNIRYSENGTDWVLKENANTTKSNYLYFKVDCVGTTGTYYSNITNISISLSGVENPTNVANYIMYEDTNNQCTTKFNVAKGYFENLTKAQRTTFMTSDDYVISTARTRFEAWARSLGKTIALSGGDYVISNAQFNVLNLQSNANIDYPIIIMVATLFIGTGCIVGFYFMKHRKEEK